LSPRVRASSNRDSHWSTSATTRGAAVVDILPPRPLGLSSIVPHGAHEPRPPADLRTSLLHAHAAGHRRSKSLVAAGPPDRSLAERSDRFTQARPESTPSELGSHRRDRAARSHRLLPRSSRAGEYASDRRGVAGSGLRRRRTRDGDPL